MRNGKRPGKLPAGNRAKQSQCGEMAMRGNHLIDKELWRKRVIRADVKTKPMCGTATHGAKQSQRCGRREKSGTACPAKSGWLLCETKPTGAVETAGQSRSPESRYMERVNRVAASRAKALATVLRTAKSPSPILRQAQEGRCARRCHPELNDLGRSHHFRRPKRPTAPAPRERG